MVTAEKKKTTNVCGIEITDVYERRKESNGRYALTVIFLDIVVPA